MMRALLSVNNYYYQRGGADVLALEQNRLVCALGWRVVPFAMRHVQNQDTPWSTYFVDEIEFGNSYGLWEKLERIPKVVYSREARQKLEQLLNTIHIDICHVHNIYHHISPSILPLLKQRGIPTVMTLHDLKLACPAYTMLAHDGICERCRDGAIRHVVRHRCVKGSVALSSLVYLETRLHRALDIYRFNVDRFVAPSRFMLEKMVEWGMPREKLVHIPNFVDVTAFPVRREVGKHFLYFGRLSKEKGLSTLLRAAAEAKVSLHVAGTGPKASALEALAHDLGGDVKFLGHLSGGRLRQVIGEARATVLPSECYENAPLSVLESYASGVPVLGAAIGGIGELVRESVTGATFASGSVASLTEKLRWIAAMPDAQVAEMGMAGRRWVAAEFSAELYRDRLIGLYAELGVVSDGMRSARPTIAP